MGSGASIDFSNVNNWSSQDLANQVASLGEGYESYGGLFIKNGIDGTMISHLPEEDISELLVGMGITNVIHKMKLKAEIIKVKQNLLRVESVTVIPNIISEIEGGKFDTVIGKFFVFGGINDYSSGLTNKIDSLHRSMEQECTTNDNGKWKAHYDYVVHEKAVEKADASNSKRIRDKGHDGWALEDFMKHDKAVEANLTQAEVVALRLYTGALYEAWNTALRLYLENPELLQDWGTCISVLYSAILKLSFQSDLNTVYRGVNETNSKLPEDFLEKGEKGFNGGVELAFMSTSTELEVAMEYAKRGKLTECTIFEIVFDATSRAADVQWVSQYYYEKELLYPPCTYITCVSVSTKVMEDGTKVRYISAKAQVSTAQSNLDKLKIFTVQDFDKTATPKKKTVSEQRISDLEDLQIKNSPITKVLEQGYTITEIASVKDWFSLQDFIYAECAWNDIYGSGCFSPDALKEAIPDFIKAGSSSTWQDLYASNIFTNDIFKQAGCPGYILKKLGVRPKELIDIGYDKIDIFTALEINNDGLTAKEIFDMGYTTAQIRQDNILIETMFKNNMTLSGHTNYVCSVIELKDGKSLASASDDNTIKIWNMNTASGECTMTLNGHTNSVNSVIELKDGKLLVSASDDNTIKIWNIASGECTMTLNGHTNWVRSVIELKDGKSLASASIDNTIKIWNVATGECTMTLNGHTAGVNSVIEIKDGKSLASASGDNTIKIWNVATGECTMTLNGHTNWVNSVIELKDGKSLASASGDSTIKIWDIDTGECTMTLNGHTNWVNSVIELKDGKSLASASGDKTIKIWNIATGECTMTLNEHTNSVRSVIELNDGKSLASASNDKTIKIWKEVVI